MTKLLINDEASKMPRYERFIITYQCGCSYYNDTWQSSCDSEEVCPEHNKPIQAKSSEWIKGLRPVSAETKHHTLKIHLGKMAAIGDELIDGVVVSETSLSGDVIKKLNP